MASLDPYKVLQVAKNASQDEIRRSFRRLAHQYHPDKNKAPDAASRFGQISEAYEVLRDEKSRKAYDELVEIRTKQKDLLRSETFQSQVDRLPNITNQQTLSHTINGIVFGQTQQRGTVAHLGGKRSLMLRELASEGSTALLDRSKNENDVFVPSVYDTILSTSRTTIHGLRK